METLDVGAEHLADEPSDAAAQCGAGCLGAELLPAAEEALRSACTLGPEAGGTLTAAAKVDRLTRWFNERGGRAPAVEIRSRRGLRGMYARYRIPRSAVVAFAPRRAILTPFEARESAVVQRLRAGLEKQGKTLHDHIELALFLVHTRRHGGPWKLYVDVIPQSLDDYRGVALFFPQREFDQLQGSFVQRIVSERWRWLKYEHRLVRACLPPEDRPSFGELLWAQMVVTSRTFGMTFEGHSTCGMVPIMDMLNHRRMSDVNYLPPHGRVAEGESMDNARGFYMRANLDIEPFSEICTSYGGKPNVAFLTQYGFCLEDNPEDVTDVYLRPDRVNVLHPDLISLGQFFGRPMRGGWRGLQVSRDYRQKDKHRQHADAVRALSYLRAAYMVEAAERLPVAVLADLHKKFDYLPPLSQANEVLALRELRRACVGRLREFATSIEEDTRLLEDRNLDYARRCIYLVRRGEKQVLQHQIDCVDEALPLLALPPAELREALDRRLRAGRGGFVQYFRDAFKHLCLDEGLRALGLERSRAFQRFIGQVIAPQSFGAADLVLRGSGAPTRPPIVFDFDPAQPDWSAIFSKYIATDLERAPHDVAAPALYCRRAPPPAARRAAAQRLAAAYAELATRLDAADRHAQAAAARRQAFALCPDDAALCVGLAHSLKREGEFEEATELYGHALSLPPAALRPVVTNAPA